MNKARKTIILTGASRGIGHATVKRFSDEGWRVITCSRQAVPKKCPWDSSEDNHVEIDFTNTKQVEIGAQKLLDLLGDKPLNALVNNAGISPKNKDGKRLDSLSTSSEIWKEVFEEDISVIEGMQEGRAGILFNGGKFSPVMDTATHVFHQWVASNYIKG